jgi:chloramphenicol-sensitive protein RarD
MAEGQGQGGQMGQTGSAPEYDRRGILLGAGAYAAWTVFPIYFRSLSAVSPLGILFSRIVFSLVFMAFVLTWTRRWGFMPAALRNRRVVVIYALAALLLAGNWYIFIWAVNNGHILETSLGYFINPLVSVLLGVIFLKERLRPGQWAAIAIAALGVAYLTWNYGHLPWIALSLAGTWGVYGLVKKRAPLPVDTGLTLETAVLFLPALIGLFLIDLQGEGTLLRHGAATDVLLFFSGPITAVPLLMFASAAKRIPLSMLGVLQYIAPTGQFLVGVYVYGEPFPTYKLIGFAIIWTALVLYWAEGQMRRRHAHAVAQPAAVR